MSLSTQQRTDIKRIIEALGRQAIELQQQRGMLIRLIQADPSYVDDVFRISRGVRYLIDPDPVAGRFQYTESVNQLIVKVQRIEASLARIKEKTTELHLLIPPIECLPAELLVLIFQAGSLSEPKGLHPFPMIVSAVSRRWRAVAMSTPTLWTNLYITPVRPRKWIPLALELSRGHLLDITVDARIDFSPSSATVKTCMAQIKPELHRWRSFALMAHHRHVMLIVGEELADVSAPTLQRLRLSLAGTDGTGNLEVYIPRLFSEGAQALTSVRFDSVAVPWRREPLVGLSTLDLRWLWFRLSWSSFEGILAASPNLTRLILRGKHVDVRPHEEYSPIHLPRLRSLEVSGDNFCLLCSLLIAPALETLTLANVDEGEFREFMAWLPYSGGRYTTLKCLMLLNVATCPLSWDFVAAFSTITQLIVINSGANQFLEILRPKWLQSATGVMHGALVWPRLRDVTMLDQTNYDDLYGMVAERTAHGSPLRRLIVHTEFVHRNMLTPLLQYVKVDSVTYLDRDL